MVWTASLGLSRMAQVIPIEGVTPPPTLCGWGPEHAAVMDAAVVQNHWLHPAGWGPDTDKPSIDKPRTKKVALSNDSPTSCSSPDQTTTFRDQARHDFACGRVGGIAMRPFHVSCPHCHDRFTVKDPKYLGNKVHCPHCQAAFRIPAQAPRLDRGQGSWAEDALTEAAAEGRSQRLATRLATPAPRFRRSRGRRRSAARRPATSWPAPWLATLAATVVGGLGSAILYPALCESMANPVAGVMGQIGTVSAGICGAICGGLGAHVIWEQRSRGRVIAVTVLALVGLAQILGHLIWHREVFYRRLGSSDWIVN